MLFFFNGAFFVLQPLQWEVSTRIGDNRSTKTMYPQKFWIPSSSYVRLPFGVWLLELLAWSEGKDQGNMVQEHHPQVGFSHFVSGWTLNGAVGDVGAFSQLPISGLQLLPVNSSAFQVILFTSSNCFDLLP